MDILRDFYKFCKQHSGGGGGLKKKSEGGWKKWGSQEMRELEERGAG